MTNRMKALKKFLETTCPQGAHWSLSSDDTFATISFGIEPKTMVRSVAITVETGDDYVRIGWSSSQYTVEEATAHASFINEAVVYAARIREFLRRS